MYVKYTYVDSVTGVPVTKAPAVNGPAMPSLPGLVYDFSNESQFPTSIPWFYGEAPEQAVDPDIFSVLSSEIYTATRLGEFAARRAKIVPEEITVRQARIVLHRRGMLPMVQDLIDGLPEPERTEAQISWDYASHYARSDKFVIMLAAGLGLTDETLDELFTEAGQL